MTTSTTSSTNGNQPVSRIFLGPVEVAIWQNAGDNNQPYYRATFGRRYRDNDGNPQSTKSYGRDDLLVLAKAADMAHTRIMELRDADYQRQREAEQANVAAAKGATR